jgi:hypothetical protein
VDHFKHGDLNLIDFYTTLEGISYMLNSRPMELLLSEYSESGGALGTVSSIPDFQIAITPNILLIGDGRTGSIKSNYTESGTTSLAEIVKVPQWQQAWGRLVRTNSS